MIDPYHKWLGISPDQRPPTHYQLLGVAESEKDRDVIESSAVRQSAYVRNFQKGEHSELATRLLNEISEARLILIDPAKRAQYDAKLAASRSKPKPAPKPVATEPRSLPVRAIAVPAVASQPPIRRHHPRPNQSTTWILVSVVTVCIAAVVGATWFVIGRAGKIAERANNSETTKPVPVPNAGEKSGQNHSTVVPNIPQPISPSIPKNIIEGNSPGVNSHSPPEKLSPHMPNGPMPGPPNLPPFVKGPPSGLFGPMFGPGRNGQPGPPANLPTKNPPDAASIENAKPFDLTRLSVGTPVLALQGRQWKNATVRQIETDRVLVNFDGFPESFNLWVTAKQIRALDFKLAEGAKTKGVAGSEDDTATQMNGTKKSQANTSSKRRFAGTLESALDSLQNGNVFDQRDACNWLVKEKIDESKKEEIAEVLNRFIASKDHHDDVAYSALVRWANDASVKLIASKLEVRPFVEKPAIMAAGKMRNETLVLPLCRLLEDFFAWKQASAALKEAGPVAERHVIRLLQHKDPKMRIEAATILAAIGTEKSVAPLRRAANDKNVKLAAQAAMENIKIRMEQDKKDK